MPESYEPVSKPRRGVNGGEAVLGDGHKVELADFPERFAGRVQDPVIVFLFVLATIIILGVDEFLRSFFSYSIGSPGDETLARNHEVIQELSLIVSLVVFGIIALYETATIRVSGQSWAKRRRGVRVVSRSDGSTPSPGRAFVRGLVPATAGAGGSVAAALADLRVPAVGGLVLWLVVYLSAMWGKEGRGWHDLAAGTIVVVDPVDEAQLDRSG